MRVSVGLNTTKEEAFCTNVNANPTLKQPSSWTSWFIIEHPSSLSYAQVVVHIAVKLKSRLLKPSIILPMGYYVAGVHHLRTVQITFGKDIHGLREKDLNHKDKQNFDAVLNIIKVASVLKKVPDAVGTQVYIELMECVVDSYLSKPLTPLERIEKMWYVVFFCSLLAFMGYVTSYLYP